MNFIYNPISEYQIEIPEQLRDPNFRFTLIKMIGENRYKAPLETGWNTTENYPYNSKKLNDWIKLGNNYGILTGIGKLIVVDADTKSFIDYCLQNLPNTFRVQTGSGNWHFYYQCEDKISTIKLSDGKSTIQGTGNHVVGPGSIHESGKRYTISDPREIKWIDKEFLFLLLKEFVPNNENNVVVTTKATIPENEVVPFNRDWPITIDIIGKAKWRHRSNEVLQKTDPTNEERAGLIYTLFKIAGLTSVEICNLIHNYCNWTNYNRATTTKKVEEKIKQISQRKSYGSGDANTTNQPGGGVVCGKVCVTNSWHNKGQYHVRPGGGDANMAQREMNITTLEEFFTKNNDRNWWTFSKKLINGNECYSLEKGRMTTIMQSDGTQVTGMDNGPFTKGIQRTTIPTNGLVLPDLYNAIGKILGKNISEEVETKKEKPKK